MSVKGAWDQKVGGLLPPRKAAAFSSTVFNHVGLSEDSFCLEFLLLFTLSQDGHTRAADSPRSHHGTQSLGFHSSTCDRVPIGSLASGAGEAKMINPGSCLKEAQAGSVPSQWARNQRGLGFCSSPEPDHLAGVAAFREWTSPLRHAELGWEVHFPESQLSLGSICSHFHCRQESVPCILYCVDVRDLQTLFVSLFDDDCWEARYQVPLRMTTL